MAYEFKTRYNLTVHYLTNAYVIEPVDNINTGKATDKEIKDSISTGNAQVIHRWPRYTFEINLPGTAKNLAIFYWADNFNKSLTLKVEEVIDGTATDTTSDIRIRTIQLERAFITDIRENIVSNDVPGIRITGVATQRSETVEDKAGLQTYSYKRGFQEGSPPSAED